MPISRAQTSALIAKRSTGEGVAPERRGLAPTALPPLLHMWFARSRQRKALLELAEDGRRLNDIGLTREQALGEAAKPFWRP